MYSFEWNSCMFGLELNLVLSGIRCMFGFELNCVFRLRIARFVEILTYIYDTNEYTQLSFFSFFIVINTFVILPSRTTPTT